MLFDLDWLQPGGNFPPPEEEPRLQRYIENTKLFDSQHFSETSTWARSVFSRVNSRIMRIVGNWEDIQAFPVLLNYHRLMTIKTADLVAGEYPTITSDTMEDSQNLKDRREEVSFDSKLYSTVLDLSRYGDAIWRAYRGQDGKDTFTLWDPKEWIPIVSQDGTNTIVYHVLAWRENIASSEAVPIYRLHVQIHGTAPADIGRYEYRLYELSPDGRSIGRLLHTSLVPTGFTKCAVMHLKAFDRSDSVYGMDDYLPLDSLMAEIMTRIGQISIILDKHANPNITGPISMLTTDPMSGEKYLKPGNFFATSPGENKPEYMTWDGQLSAAFKELEMLINQLYILSEMGSAMLGAMDGGAGQAISGTAMRFKMVNPVAKARRISNALTRQTKILMEMLTGIPLNKISVFWYDGLPDDPRENVEIAKLATGEQRLMPLKDAIMEYFERSPEEAERWVKALSIVPEGEDPNKPGAGNGDGIGVNPMRKGSTTGVSSFHGINNQN